jgi:hypothetical protein
MRRLQAVLLALLAGAVGCSPRHESRTTQHPVLEPPQPPPPGQVTVYGPLRVESVLPVRSEAGWDRDFVHGSRVVAYDVVLAQERAACPKEIAEKAFATDEEGCKGLATIPESCKTEPTLRARAEVSVTFALDLSARCAGDAAAFPTDGDPKTALSNGARACFRARNKLKPESSWTSLYELTELRLAERMESVSTATPRLLARLLAGSARHCRDDGAYLDGTAGRPSPTLETAPVDLLALGATLTTRAPLGGAGDAASTPLTSDWKTEHAVWEQCNQKPARDHVVASERCLMLRQLDRFLRDVEDIARTETPKGTGP